MVALVGGSESVFVHEFRFSRILNSSSLPGQKNSPVLNPRFERFSVTGDSDRYGWSLSNSWSVGVHRPRNDSGANVLAQCPSISEVCFGPSGGNLAFGAVDGVVTVASPLTGVRIASRVHTDVVSSLIFDENILVSASYDGSVQFLDPSSLGIVARYPFHDDAIYSVMSVDPHVLLSSSRDRTVRLFDLRTRQEVAIFPHHGPVFNVCCVGNCVVSSCFNQLFCWDIRKLGTPDQSPLCSTIDFAPQNVISANSLKMNEFTLSVLDSAGSLHVFDSEDVVCRDPIDIVPRSCNILNLVNALKQRDGGRTHQIASMDVRDGVYLFGDFAGGLTVVDTRW